MARDSWLHLKGLDSTLEIASEERNRTCLQDMNFGPFLADSIRPHAGLSLYLSLGSFETTANWMFQIVGPHFFCGAFSHVSAWRIRHCDVTRHNEPAQNGRNSWGWGEFWCNFLSLVRLVDRIWLAVRIQSSSMYPCTCWKSLYHWI